MEGLKNANRVKILAPVISSTVTSLKTFIRLHARCCVENIQQNRGSATMHSCFIHEGTELYSAIISYSNVLNTNRFLDNFLNRCNDNKLSVSRHHCSLITLAFFRHFYVVFVRFFF